MKHSISEKRFVFISGGEYIVIMSSEQSVPSVLYDARMIQNSGIGTQVYNVCSRLIPRPDIQLTLAGDRDKLPLLLPEFKGDIRHYAEPIYTIKEQFKFPSAAFKGLIHIPHYNAPVKELSRSIVVVHDLIHLMSDEFRRPIYRSYASFLLSQISKRAQLIITVSDSTRRDLIRFFPKAEKRAITIHNGIDHTLFKPNSATRLAAFRKKIKLSEGYLLCVGIGKRHKNIDFVIRALAPLWKNGHLKLKLALGGTEGTVPDYLAHEIGIQKVQDYITVLPNFSKEEMSLLYGASSLFIMPSLLEGFGFPLVEAMASGAVVLSSNASSLPEVGGDAPIYFDPTYEEDLTQAVMETLKDSRIQKKVTTAGAKEAARFDWDRHVQKLVEVYKKYS